MSTKKEVIALAFSDLHISDWAKFNKDNQRTLNHFKVLSILREICLRKRVPLLFCGDLLHKPESITQGLLGTLQEQFRELNSDSKFKCYAVSGNHDQSNISLISTPSPSWINIFSEQYNWLNCLDFKTERVALGFYNIEIHGIPYIDHNKGLNEYLRELPLDSACKHILLLHTDYPGAKDCDGRVVDSVENLNINILSKRFDLVLCGHIHKPQRLGKKVYMIGAPLQQMRTDKNNELGYWEIYKDLTLKFVPLEDFPKFIDVESEDEIKDDGNYYTVLPKKASIEVNTKHKITKRLSKKVLAKRYLKEKGIKDKVKQNLLINVLKKSEV